MLGVMIDCSRNAVMSVKAVKEYVNLLKKMGYDTLMLYTEDTYEVDGEPYFGYMRGKYTKSELRELDAYCNANDMELIPCVQTLAHVNAIFQASDMYKNIRDCDDILLIDNERTYEFLEHIFSTLSECFTTRKVHIGMDEADKVGFGKYLKQHGYTERFDLINKHLHRVCEIAGRYDFEPMIWSDMFRRLAANTLNCHDGDNLEAIRERANLPENVMLVYWNYNSEDYGHYVRRLKENRAFGRPVAFAGGAWTWKGFTPDNDFSIRTTKVALDACKAQDVGDVLMTMWGDDGAECSRFSILPALLYAAEAKRGNTDMEDIKKKFVELTGMQWDDFMLLDQFNVLQGKHRHNPSKYLLYNDPLMGLNDCRVEAGDGSFYRDLRQKLELITVNTQFQTVFDTAIALCKVLEVKAELGIRTRNAYQIGDKFKLQEIAVNDYGVTIAKLEEFYRIFSKQWHAENKPFGFDVQDIRIGGLIWRLKQSSQRLLAYVEGSIEQIPELEEEILEGTGGIHWTNIATPNVVSHLFFG